MDPHTDIDEMSAFERLISILKCKKIQAHKLPWTNRSAVCFTECPWGSLLRHAKSYSPYGIGFTKKLVYSRNGNPVIYANPRMFQSEKWDESVFPFVTPFVLCFHWYAWRHTAKSHNWKCIGRFSHTRTGNRALCRWWPACDWFLPSDWTSGYFLMLHYIGVPGRIQCTTPPMFFIQWHRFCSLSL